MLSVKCLVLIFVHQCIVQSATCNLCVLSILCIMSVQCVSCVCAVFVYCLCAILLVTVVSVCHSSVCWLCDCFSRVVYVSFIAMFSLCCLFVWCLCAFRLCVVVVLSVLRIVCAMSVYCVVCMPPLVMFTLRRPSVCYLCAVRLWLCVPECFPSHGLSVCSPSVCLAVCRPFVNKLCAARRKYFVCYPSMGFMC